MQVATAERTIGRDYCRGCGAHSVQTFSGFATADGRENGVRPRAFYRQCQSCGTPRLLLQDVDDAEGLCRATLRQWIKTTPFSAFVGATGALPFAGPIDLDEMLGRLQERLWQLYSDVWDPGRCASFTAFSSALLAKAARKLASDESGEPERRTNGRVHPKAHAASVSVSYDALAESAGGEDNLELGHTDHLDASEAVAEALRRSPLATRKIVLLLECGYTQAEAADRIGLTPQQVSVLLRDLRGDVDSVR